MIVLLKFLDIGLFDIDAILRKNNKINNCFVFTKENFEKEKIICAAIEGKKINERSIVEKLKKICQII